MTDVSTLHMAAPAAPPGPNDISFGVSKINNPDTGTPYSVDRGTPVTPNPADDSRVIYAQADDVDTSVVPGIAVTAGEYPGSVRVRFSGPLTLTTEEWDARVTGQSGGLTPRQVYWLDDVAAGKYKLTPPESPNFVTPIGFAINATTMMIQIGTPVVGA